MDDPEVFETSHALILDLAGRGVIQGLRVDHVDGLTDPKAYLDRLQRRLTEVRPNSAPFYIWVEKILIGEERLPEDWPVAGTTGYEFMNEILGVLVARPGLDALAAVAERFIGSPQDFGAIVGAAKREVLAKQFAGELAVLARRASAVCGLDEAMAADALRRLLVAFPVYRTYAGTTWSARDIGVLEEAFDSAGATADDAGRAALDQLEHSLAAGAVGLGPLLHRAAAAVGASDGEVDGGHGVLSLPSAPGAERGRRSARHSRHAAGGVSSGSRVAARPLAGHAAGDGDARYEAGRGCAGTPCRAERGAGGLGGSGRRMARHERARCRRSIRRTNMLSISHWWGHGRRNWPPTTRPGC